MKIIIFGPNGSGKGTQGAFLKKKFEIPHIETGVLFREHKKNNTPLGQEMAKYMDRGDLVPDELTIRILWDRLGQTDCKEHWLLDGFPRNPAQAQNLLDSLKKRKVTLDYLIEIKLDRALAKARLMGRQVCTKDPNHPNNTQIQEILPLKKEGQWICRVCQSPLNVRADDVDELAINKRHDIYYDAQNGTLAAVYWLKAQLASSPCRIIELNGAPSVEHVSKNLELQLK